MNVNVNLILFNSIQVGRRISMYSLDEDNGHFLY